MLSAWIIQTHFDDVVMQCFLLNFQLFWRNSLPDPILKETLNKPTTRKYLNPAIWIIKKRVFLLFFCHNQLPNLWNNNHKNSSNTNKKNQNICSRHNFFSSLSSFYILVGIGEGCRTITIKRQIGDINILIKCNKYEFLACRLGIRGIFLSFFLFLQPNKEKSCAWLYWRVCSFHFFKLLSTRQKKYSIFFLYRLFLYIISCTEEKTAISKKIFTYI